MLAEEDISADSGNRFQDDIGLSVFWYTGLEAGTEYQLWILAIQDMVKKDIMEEGRR